MGLITSVSFFGFTLVITVIALDVNSVLGLLHHVIVSDVTNFSKVPAPSIFMKEICRLVCTL